MRELRRVKGLAWHDTSSAAEADAVIASLPEDLDLLAVNGGDGTLQHALTTLLQRRDAPLPRIAMLPGGSTNMSAFDISGRRSWRESAAHLLAVLKHEPSEWPCTGRHVIEVHRPGEELSAYGMFFGTGVVVRGIEYCHEWIYRLGIRNEWAPGLALLRAVWGIARREAAFTEGVHVALARPGHDAQELCAKFLIVSSLGRMFLGLRPFWDQEGEPLHFTLVRQGAEAFLRTLPSLLRGRRTPGMTSANGYWSGSLNALGLSLDGPYTIDGEIFAAPETGALEIKATPPIQFVKLF